MGSNNAYWAVDSFETALYHLEIVTPNLRFFLGKERDPNLLFVGDQIKMVAQKLSRYMIEGEVENE